MLSNIDFKTSFLPITYNFVFRLSLVVVGWVALFLIIFVKTKSAVGAIGDPLLLFYTLFVTTFELSRVASAMIFPHTLRHIHKANTAKDSLDYEPHITFVIPCKNEGEAIAKTVTKCFQADYPEDKVEVIVINDGSTDNTLDVLIKQKEVYPKLKIIDWKVNRGKRHGMAEGFKMASGDIIIQLDSDSHINPTDVRKIILPFQNEKIGAVCAHADPENADTNWLTKMQAAYYFVSFRILKAAESTFMSVFCCSGCSSAYRKSVVLPIIDTWLNETFLGLPVTWGDDRALTNWVLKRGYKTIYSNEVQAYTICPEGLKQFIKQQIRWKKGWFVNSIFASKFILKKDPFVALTYFFPLIFITLITPFMALKALVINPVFRGISPVYYVLGVLLVAIIITTYYRWLSPNNKYWPYVFLWSALNMVILSFVLFYALLTIQNRKWGTR